MGKYNPQNNGIYGQIMRIKMVRIYSRIKIHVNFTLEYCVAVHSEFE